MISHSPQEMMALASGWAEDKKDIGLAALKHCWSSATSEHLEDGRWNKTGLEAES